MKKILFLFLIPVMGLCQFNPIDSNTYTLWDTHLGVVTTNDSMDTWIERDSTINGTSVTTKRPTLANCATTYINFDGTDDYLTTGTTLNWGTSDFTIDVYFNSDVKAYNKILISKSTGNNETRWRFGLLADINQIQFQHNSENNPAPLNSDSILSIDTWYLYTIVKDGNDGVMYCNADTCDTLIGFFDDTNISSAENVVIGARDNFAANWDGKIAFIRISLTARNKAHTDSLYVYIQTRYASGLPYYVSNAGGDSSSGRVSDGLWKTISKISEHSFSGGDYIYLNRGNSWDETVSMLSSGSSGNQITLSYYGSGLYPIVNQINVNNNDYIKISNCITVINGIINTGGGYVLDVSICPVGHEVQFMGFPEWPLTIEN